MKVTMTKIWVAATILALVGIAQAQSQAASDREVSGQMMSANPYLIASQK